MRLYGGFDGAETQRDERDWENNATILSGDIGVSGNNTDNCYHVFYHPDGTNLDSTAVLDGFTVTAGNAAGVFPHSNGGGISTWVCSQRTDRQRDQDIFINNHTEIRELVEQISSVIRGEIPVLSPNKEVWDKPGFQAKLERLQEAIK